MKSCEQGSNSLSGAQISGRVGGCEKWGLSEEVRCVSEGGLEACETMSRCGNALLIVLALPPAGSNHTLGKDVGAIRNHMKCLATYQCTIE